MNAIEKAEQDIKDYKVLAEAAEFIKDSVKMGAIPADLAVEKLADLVMVMLRANLEEAKETKAKLESIRAGSHLAGL